MLFRSGGFINVESKFGVGSIFTFAIKANVYSEFSEIANDPRIETATKININDVPKITNLPKRSIAVFFC